MKLRRIAIVSAFGVLLIGGAAFYIYAYQIRPIGSGPAGPAISREAFSKAWTNREILLVGLGDSVTAGLGARKGYSYFDRLVTNPPDEFKDMRGISLSAVFPNLHCTNLAISGSTSMEHAEKEIPRLPATASNVLGVIVITTGGNDLIHNYGRTPPHDQAMYGATLDEAKPWIAEFEQRLRSMLDELEKHFPSGCEIFLADIYDPTDGRGDIQRTGLPPWKDGTKILATYNEIIHRAAQKDAQVHVVEFHDSFLGHGIHCTQFWSGRYDWHDPHYWYYSNLEDPNERGYDVIRRLFLIEMQKTFDPAK